MARRRQKLGPFCETVACRQIADDAATLLDPTHCSTDYCAGYQDACRDIAERLHARIADRSFPQADPAIGMELV